MVEMGGNVNISERKYLAVYSDVANKDIVIQENINKHGKKNFPVNQLSVTCTLRYIQTKLI